MKKTAIALLLGLIATAAALPALAYVGTADLGTVDIDPLAPFHQNASRTLSPDTLYTLHGIYYVQAGAYSRPEDAETQRARLAMLGLDAKVMEREQSGRTVYRVRLGPYEGRPDAEAVQARLAGDSIEANLVRVER